jgi:hypothetical protein
MEKASAVAGLRRHIEVQRQRQENGIWATSGELMAGVASSVELAASFMMDLGDNPVELVHSLVPNGLSIEESELILARLACKSQDVGASCGPTITPARKRLKTSSDIHDKKEGICPQGNNVQNLMDLPEETLQKIASFLQFQEQAILFAVNKKWNDIVQKTEVIRFGVDGQQVAFF